MISAGAIIAGLPLPSTDPVFLVLVAVHITLGPLAAGSGALAMLSPKGRGRHSLCGTIYFWSLAGVFLTMSALSFMRWHEDYPLFFLGMASFGAALFGKWAIRQAMIRVHLASMGASYITMLTAFYVDNGKNLPLWRDLSQTAFWIMPAAVGVPIILYYWVHLPSSSPAENRRAEAITPDNR